MRTMTVAGALLMAAGLAIVSASSMQAAAPPKGKDIMWGSFPDGLKYTQKNNLPLMISVSESGCPWCVKLEKEVYTAPDVIQASQSFVCVKVDAKTPANIRKEVIDHYKVAGFPTVVFANSKGEEVSRVPGFMPADGFIAQMKAAMGKLGVAEGTEKGDARKPK